MKLLIDQGVFRRVAGALRALGVDAVHTSEIGMDRALDPAIIALARREGWIIVTHDSDFHTILAFTDAASPSVIRVRDDLSAESIALLVAQVIRDHSSVLGEGAAVSVKSRRVRVHRLPFGG